jgi:hypothetical protein
VNPKNAGRSEKINLNLDEEESSMQSRTSTLFAFTLGSAMTFGAAAIAADLPQSGTIKIHSDSKVNVQATEVGDKHIMASANAWGVTHNDLGSGPLNMGAWFCAFSFENVNGPPNYSGSCAFGDAGGADKILITFTGKGNDIGGDQGTGTIIGGIGKYAGIDGKMVWQCHSVDATQGLTACTQQFDYRLMAVSATK